MIFSLILGTLLLSVSTGITTFLTGPLINQIYTPSSAQPKNLSSTQSLQKTQDQIQVAAPIDKPAHKEAIDNYIAWQQFAPRSDDITLDSKTMTLDNQYISPQQSHTLSIKSNNATIAQVRQLAGLNQGTSLACGYYSLYHARILSFLDDVTSSQFYEEARINGLCNREAFFKELQRMIHNTTIYQNAITLGINFIDNAYLGYIGMITQSLNDYSHIKYSINSPENAYDFESANNALGISQNDFIAQVVAFIHNHSENIKPITMVARLAHEGSESGHFIAVRIEKKCGIAQITLIDSLLHNRCREIAQEIKLALN